MIVCHPLKIIFVKTTKVGGTSFEIALSYYCSDKCIITEISPDDEKLRKQLGYRSAQNSDPYSPFNNLKFWRKNTGYSGKFWNHIESDKIKRQVPEAVWDEYTKIAIHRNPFDVLVSRYFWSQRDIEEKDRIPFDKWFLRDPRKAAMNLRIAPVSGEFSMDKIIRYDYLEQDIDALGIDGLWALYSSIRTKVSNHWAYRLTTDAMYKNRAEVVDLVCQLCAEEISYFGYEIPRV